MGCRLFPAIIWTNVGLLSIWHMRTHCSEILLITISWIKNAFENVVWQMPAIFSRTQFYVHINWIKLSYVGFQTKLSDQTNRLFSINYRSVLPKDKNTGIKIGRHYVWLPYNGILTCDKWMSYWWHNQRNTIRPEWHDRHFTYSIFKCIFLK